MKRYVLTKDKEIRLRTEQDDLNANVDRSSDNILDFAEYDDLLEIENDGTDYVFVTKEYPVSEIVKDYKVIALWKRNGDVMRRYAVK